MFLSMSRRLATPFFAATAAVGLLFAGTGTALADDPPVSQISGTAANLTFSANVVGSNVVHPGDTVSFQYDIAKPSGVARYITTWKSLVPPGFKYVEASASVNYGFKITNVEADGVRVQCNSGCSVLGGGFVVGNPIRYTVSYKVPADFALGRYNTGVGFDVYSYSGSQGASGVQIDVVDPAVDTTTGLQIPATAKTGDSVSLTANVGPANSVGTVQFKDGGTNIGGPVTVSGGVATLPHTFDTVGAHNISAVFTAGAGFHDSVSAAQTVDVTADTTTTLTAPATAVVGEDVTFTASVDPSAATGQVQFKDGGANIDGPMNVVNGQASVTRRFVEAGSHSVTANFVGTGGYNASNSAPAELTVKDADFGTTTTVLEPVTATVGTPVNLSATVGPIPTGGDVKFRVDGVEVGSVPVGTGDGVAILQHTFTAPGTAKVVAEFTGTQGFTGSTSTEFDVTVNAPDTREATTTALAVSGDAVVGQAMTFKATVAPAGANGTVQFKTGTTAIGAPVPVIDGVATLAHTFDTAGTYGVTANFVGGDAFKDSVSGPTVVNVTAAGTPGGVGTGSLASLFAS